MTSADGDIGEFLPPKPQAPHPSDCCGTGCCPCVHDIYEQDLKAWKTKCNQIRDRCLVKEGVEVGGAAVVPDQWRKFEVVKIEQSSHDTYCYTFKLQDDQLLGLSIGQHIITKQVKNGRVVTRQYTPVSEVDKRGSFLVLIKIYPTGRITPLVKEWKIGDCIPWRGPFGEYKYQANSYKHILMLAAGTGIAPMYQIIRAVIDNEDDETFVKLLYANKSISDILLRDELVKCSQYWNFTLCHYLSNEGDVSKKKYSEEIIKRRICKKEVQEELMKRPGDTTLVLICGTNSFNKDMVNAVKDAEIADKNIFKF